MDLNQQDLKNNDPIDKMIQQEWEVINEKMNYFTPIRNLHLKTDNSIQLNLSEILYSTVFLDCLIDKITPLHELIADLEKGLYGSKNLPQISVTLYRNQYITIENHKLFCLKKVFKNKINCILIESNDQLNRVIMNIKVNEFFLRHIDTEFESIENETIDSIHNITKYEPNVETMSSLLKSDVNLIKLNNMEQKTNNLFERMQQDPVLLSGDLCEKYNQTLMLSNQKLNNLQQNQVNELYSLKINYTEMEVEQVNQENELIDDKINEIKDDCHTNQNEVIELTGNKWEKLLIEKSNELAFKQKRNHTLSNIIDEKNEIIKNKDDYIKMLEAKLNM